MEVVRGRVEVEDVVYGEGVGEAARRVLAGGGATVETGGAGVSIWMWVWVWVTVRTWTAVSVKTMGGRGISYKRKQNKQVSKLYSR